MTFKPPIVPPEHHPLCPPIRRPAPHAGVMVPWANRVVEVELPLWAGEDVAWHWSRLMPPGERTALSESFLIGLLEAVPEAALQLSKLPLARLYLACTSAAFTHPERIAALLSATAVPVPLVTAFDALTEALCRMNAKRIVLLTPYPDAITAIEAAQFEARGVTVTATRSLGIADGYADICAQQVTALADEVSKAALQAAHATVLSCTGWPTRHLLSSLRQRLGVPVISSNLAIVMHARNLRDEAR